VLHVFSRLNSRLGSRLVVFLAVSVLLLLSGIRSLNAQITSSGEGCVFTPELLDGQGFSVSGLGFSVSGLGFSVSGLGFSVSGLGFSVSGLGVTPEQVAQEIVDENNRIDSQWLIDHVPNIAGGADFNTIPVALIVVDDFGGNPDDHAEPAPDDTHGKKVKDVADTLIADLGLDAVPNPQITVFPVDVSDIGASYRVDAVASRLRDKVNDLITNLNYRHIVINISFGVLPCDADVTLADGTQVNFSFDNALHAVREANQPQNVINFLECISDYGDGRLIAHFGYENPNGAPVIIPPGSDNQLIGGGLSAEALEAQTPTYFGRPNVVDGQPGRSAPFPNSAFQVVFDPDYSLKWTLFGNTVSASKDSPKCMVARGYGFTQYFSEVLGLEPDQISDLMSQLLLHVEDDPGDPLGDLRILLRELLERSANEDGFAAIPVAAAGNFRYLFPRNNPEDSSEPLPPAPPLSPASLQETIATSALLGSITEPAGPGAPSANNRDILWRFSHDGNVAVPGGAIELSDGNLVVGTSFAAPYNSVLAALWLTYPDACTFEYANRPPLNLTSAGDFVNALYTDEAIAYPLTCSRRLVVNVDIDVKPGNEPNTLNPDNEGTILAAILSSPDFDAAFVDPTTVTLAQAPVRTIGQRKLDVQFKDVNNDGRADMLLRFNTADMELPHDMTEAVLEGALLDGTPIRGVDSLRIVPTTPVTLLSIPDGATSSLSTVTLVWSPAMGGVCYLVEVDNNADFTSPEQQATVVSSEQYTTQVLTDGAYYWRVQVGGTCLETSPGPWSETWSFTIAAP
jgi:hypothetical protein